jgi:hypothetical protein
MRIEWDADGLKSLTKEVGRHAAKETQAVLDRVLRVAKGKPIEDVKRLLRGEWRSTLGGDITDSELTGGPRLRADWQSLLSGVVVQGAVGDGDRVAGEVDPGRRGRRYGPSLCGRRPAGR